MDCKKNLKKKLEKHPHQLAYIKQSFTISTNAQLIFVLINPLYSVNTLVEIFAWKGLLSI